MFTLPDNADVETAAALISDKLLDELFAGGDRTPIRTDASVRNAIRELELLRLAGADEGTEKISDPVVAQNITDVREALRRAKEAPGHFSRGSAMEEAGRLVRQIVAFQNFRQVLGLSETADEAQVTKGMDDVPEGEPYAEVTRRIDAMYHSPGAYGLHNALATRWNERHAPRANGPA